jgi:hypothetical protein
MYIIPKQSVVRGGGGGEGSLGVQFNIVTNQEDRQARQKTMMRTGPRVSTNVKDPWLEGTNKFGEHVNGKANILNGKIKPLPQAPPRPTPESLKRPDEAILRTRPW